MTHIYDINVTDIHGKNISMKNYAGNVLLIVNVASKCGFTKQYAGLEKLYRQFKDSGLVVLGFPCNQFGKQEPGDESEISHFCRLAYDVTFPMFSKIKVNGSDTHPLYVHLKQETKGVLGSAIKWNFSKFLVGRDGAVINRFAPAITPEDLVEEVKSALGI